VRDPRPEDAAVTGVGLVTPLGTGADATRAAIASGARVGATAGVDEGPGPAGLVPELETQAKFLNGSGRMAATAVEEAVAAARLEAAGLEDRDKSLVLAQIDLTSSAFLPYRDAFDDATDRHAKSAAEVAEALNAASVRRMNPFYLLETLNNNAFSFLSARYGLRGSNTSLSGGSVAGIAAVSVAARSVARGDARASVACGACRFATPLLRMELARPGRLPAGGVAGDAAGALVLEGLEAARARGARPLAVLLGHGAAFGSARTGGASDEALAAAAAAALREAGAAAGEVARVLTGDASRGEAFAEVPALRGVPVTSVRGALGHAGCGSDAVEAGLAVLDAAEGRGATLVVAGGFDGQAAALLVAPA
jgi:3-oxoacyl-[acyl-carrier-protein] synthase II